MNKLFYFPRRTLSLSRGDWVRCWPKPDYGPVDVQRSVLLNGMRVACAKPLGAQIGSCTIMFQAGSRYEIDDYVGATHFIRAASTASTCAYSGFHKMRFLAQKGVALTCTSDRQSIAYTLRCPINIFSEVKCYLLDTILRCNYKEWEIDDLRPMIRDDHHRILPEKRVIDLAQKACWMGPLNNSTYCDPARVDTITGAILEDYTTWNYKSDHCTVASLGLPFDEIVKMAEAIEPRREKPDPRPHIKSFPRRGFEYYDLGPHSDTWICVVVPGCGTSNISTLMKHAIVASACGTTNMQDGLHKMDRTPQQPLGLMSADDVHTEYRAFNLSYYDTGVFGIVVKTRASSAWNVAKAASEFLANIGDLSFKQIDIGKKRLKVSLAVHDDYCTKVTEGIALQLANDVLIDSCLNSMAMVDAIPNDDIVRVAQGLSQKYCEMAVAVVGDVARVPHDKELIGGF